MPKAFITACPKGVEQLCRAHLDIGYVNGKFGVEVNVRCNSRMFGRSELTIMLDGPRVAEASQHLIEALKKAGIPNVQP